MVARSRGRLLASGLVALTLGITLTACGTDAGEELSDAVPSVEVDDSPSASPAASPSAEPSSPSPKPSASAPTRKKSAKPSVSPSASVVATRSATPAAEPSPASRPRRLTLRQQLLTAREVPGFNPSFTWRVTSTRMREGRALFGTCQKFDMRSIGAMRVAVRDYAPTTNSPGSTAGNLVATFADTQTAVRAYEVLKSWRAQCREELAGYDRRDVGKLQSVSTSRGLGHWYLLVYGPARNNPDSGYFDAQGIARVGRSVSWLELRLESQDYNYPVGKEPMVRAVRSSAAKIG